MGGTTEETMIPRTSATSTFPIANRLRKRTPYSSTVRGITVATRQCAIRRGLVALPAKPAALFSYTPSTVLVFPTSRTRSIFPPRPYASRDNDAQALVCLHTEKAARIKAVGYPVVTTIFIHMDGLALRIRRARFHASHDGLKAQRGSANGAAHGAKQCAILAVECADQRCCYVPARKILTCFKR